MNRLRKIDRREKIRYRPASMYSHDPASASAGHTHLRVREEIRQEVRKEVQRGIAATKAHPNGKPGKKERLSTNTIANAMAPRSRTLRTLLTVILALYRAGRGTGKREASKERA